MANSRTLVQRIALDGGQDIKKELLSLGKAGEQAFKALERQATASKKAATGFNADIARLRASMVNLGNAAQKVGGHFRFLGGAVGQFVGVMATAFSADALINATSAWTDMTSRIKLAVGAGEDANEVMKRISETAKGTYTSLEATATQFADNAYILNALGVSTKKQLDLQEALNNVLVVSGARGQRLEQVQRSFSNALQLGALRGEDFNNMSKSGSRLMELLAKKLGVNVTALKGMAAQGLITRDVLIDVLLKAQTKVREEAASMPATIRDAFTNLNTAFITFIGTADQGVGVSSALAEAIQMLADNLHIVIPLLLTLAGAFLAIKLIGLAKDMFGLATVLVKDVVPAIFKVTAALATNPFGLAAVIVAALLVAIIEATGGFENFGKVALQVAGDIYAALVPLVQPVIDFLTAVGGAVKGFLVWSGLVKGESAEAAEAAGQVDKVLRETNDSLTDSGKEAKRAGVELSTGFDKALGSVANVSEEVGGLAGSLGDAVAQAKSLVEELTKLGAIDGKSGGGAGGGSTPRFAGGGPVRGPGSGTSDSILARLSNGEFVMRAKAVRKWGIGVLNRLNKGLPAFASGGLVSGLPRPALAPAFAGGPAMGGGGPSGRPLTLVLDGETFGGLSAPEDVAGKLVNFATGRKVRSAGKKPGWYGA